MSLQKTLYAIRGAALEQRALAEFDFCDDDDESRPLGFSITLEGCSGKDVSTGDTFRECVDEDMKLTAQRNSE